MNITSDHTDDITVQNNDSEANTGNHINEDPIGTQRVESTTMPITPLPLMSYAVASQNAVSDMCMAMPTQISQPKPVPNRENFWTDQIRKIITLHNQGTRTLVILRGLPGSGKSYLAKQIVEMTVENSFNNYNQHIFSTDDYFMVRGQYQFDKLRLSEAHKWNQIRTKEAAIQGLSPIIVDNTNIELWEMEPYVRNAVNDGYVIEVVEPTTPWAKKLNQLARKNTHDVPIPTIKKMLENYHEGLTGEILIKQYRLSYPSNMVPPVLRTKPAYIEKQQSENVSKESSVVGLTTPVLSTDSKVHQEPTVSSQNQEQSISCQNLEPIKNLKKPTEVNEIKENASVAMDNSNEFNRDDEQNMLFSNQSENLTEEELKKHKLFMETQKRIEELEKVVQEWENGESWNDNSLDIACQHSNPLDTIPKPPRNNDDITPSEKLLESVKKCEDWSIISRFMPSWDIPSTSGTTQSPSIKVEKKCSSTSIELGDTDNNNMKNLKILSASPRNINEYHVSINKEKIPDKRMLDKSSMTNEEMTGGYRCKNEEKHFIAFRKLFKNVARADLRDVFDKCRGDVNWAVDIVFDSVANKSLEMLDDEDLSDMEEDNSEQCDCMAAYNIIPNMESSNATITSKTTINEENSAENVIETSSPKKSKRDTSLSDTSLLLKQHIEQQVVIAKKHYSPRHLMYKKLRHGDNEDILNHPSTSENVDVPTLPDPNETTAYEDNSDDGQSSASDEELEKFVTVNVGMEFVTQLDNFFGRKDMAYPGYIVPKISMPLTLFNEINAFWTEALTYQFEQQAKHSEIMMKQDEEFARQLAIKEAELLHEGKEPAVPDFKEIMDMDLAVALYHKDVDEWRNNEPKDLAARLSRDKLYNLFPDVAPAVLSELLMAHNNNFQSTVEVLLMSTGRTDILESENGINKFVMEKEMERQEKLLEEEKKASMDVEWPLLPKGETVVEMSTVEKYRKEAEKHLQRRNLNHQKANDYIRRGMTQVANYYSSISSFHKQKYEQANSLAAATLMQVHALNNRDSSTIDLHYLRVGEAKETLDLFLDSHITKLQETQGQVGAKFHTLFFITGRGLHSPCGPKIKPAVKARLRERGLVFSERNPGLLTAKVCAQDKLSHQVPAP